MTTFETLWLITALLAFPAVFSILKWVEGGSDKWLIGVAPGAAAFAALIFHVNL